MGTCNPEPTATQQLVFPLNSGPSNFEDGTELGKDRERQRIAAYFHNQLAPDLMALAFSIEAIRLELESEKHPAEAKLKEHEFDRLIVLFSMLTFMSGINISKSTEGTRARCCWEVVCGLIPGRDPLPEYTRRWVITGEWWEGLQNMSEDEFAKQYPNGQTEFITYQCEAHEYARSLTNPDSFNWVRVDWIWF